MSQNGLIKKGACSVSVDGLEIGRTAGPVALRVEPVWRPVRDERFGESMTDAVLIGARVSATMKFSGADYEKLRLAIPHAFAHEDRLGIGRAPGFRASESAFEMRLRPIGRMDEAQDVAIHRAVVINAVEAPAGADEGRTFEVAFAGLVDPDKSDGDLIAEISR